VLEKRDIQPNFCCTNHRSGGERIGDSIPSARRWPRHWTCVKNGATKNRFKQQKAYFSMTYVDAAFCGGLKATVHLSCSFIRFWKTDRLLRSNTHFCCQFCHLSSEAGVCSLRQVSVLTTTFCTTCYAHRRH